MVIVLQVEFIMPSTLKNVERDITFALFVCYSGPSCSKLTKLLVNDSLKFT